MSRVDLQAEHEERSRQEMKRLLQSGLHDFQMQFFGQSASRGGRRGPQTGGRGGKPQGQRGPNQRNKSQPKNQAQAAGAQKPGMPAIALPPIDPAQLAAFATLDEKKQFIGNAIYPCIN